MNEPVHHDLHPDANLDRLVNRLVGALLLVIATALVVLQAHPPG
jgi:hypothetical protein